MQPVSLYLHIPFCRHRCCYCDFNTYSGLEWLIPNYVEALLTEAEIVSLDSPSALRIGTIYLGGGTPSLLSERYIDRIINELNDLFDIDKDAEFTVEANPGTISLEYLMSIRKSGVNRLSIGMQSSNPFDLGTLERFHDYTDVIHAVEWSRLSGFENISLDLIFAIPGQSLQSWKNSLELAMGLHPDHLSIYALTIEERTPLWRWTKRGLIEETDPDLAAEMYEWASESLMNHGFHQYEISNWARPDDQSTILSSRHNLQYWHNLPYLGLGAGAHGYINNYRVVNHRSPKEYIKRLADAEAKQADRMVKISDGNFFHLSPACVEYSYIDRSLEMSETMMMGLRLVDQGIDKAAFQARFGACLGDIYGAEIQKLVNQGLLEWAEAGKRLRLTARGRLLGNRVFMEFV